MLIIATRSMFIIVAIVCLGVGFIAGKVSQHSIYCARTKSLLESRNERGREVRFLRARITHLEARERTLASTRPSA
jgi:hypothetical protein